jgi:predicted XRE-type DNA-binding protein
LRDFDLLDKTLNCELKELNMEYKDKDYYKSLTLDGKSKIIKHLMIDADLTQAAIAKATGVAQGDLSKYLALDGAHKSLDKVIDFLFSEIKSEI